MVEPLNPYIEKEDGIKVEVVVIRTLVPLDIKTIAGSVNRSGKAVVITQSPYTGSFSAHADTLLQNSRDTNYTIGTNCTVAI